MGKYGEILEDFYTERTRILDALAQDEEQTHHHAPDRCPGIPHALPDVWLYPGQAWT